MANFYKKSQLGRSMVEMLGVLAIIGVLSIGGIAAYNKAVEKHKINETIDEITTIVQDIRTLANGRGYDFLYGDIKNLGIISENKIKKGKIINPFGGEIQLNATDGCVVGKCTSNGLFYIGLNKLSRNACIAIATHDWGDFSSGFVAVGALTDFDDPAYHVECFLLGESWSNISEDGFAYACSKVPDETPMSMESAALGCSCGDDAVCAVELSFY